MKMLRKLAAFSLAMLLLMSLMPTAALATGDEPTRLTLGVEQRLTLSEEWTRFEFTPAAAGFYRFQGTWEGKDDYPDNIGADLHYSNDMTDEPREVVRAYFGVGEYDTERQLYLREHELITYLEANEAVEYSVNSQEECGFAVCVQNIPADSVYSVGESITLKANDNSTTRQRFGECFVLQYTPADSGIYSAVSNPENEVLNLNMRALAPSSGASPSFPGMLEANQSYYIFCKYIPTTERTLALNMKKIEVAELQPGTPLSVNNMSIVGDIYVAKFSPREYGSYTLTLTNNNSESSLIFFVQHPTLNTIFAYARAYEDNVGDRVVKESAVAEFTYTDRYSDCEFFLITVEGYSQFDNITDTLTATYSGDAVVEAPTVTDSLVYNGDYRSPFHYVPIGDMYAGSINYNVDVGEYSTTLSLRSGCKWSDGTTDPKVYHWSITPAPATVKAPSKSIYVGDALPELDPSQCTITGLFGEDEIGTIELSYASEPDTSAAGTVAINATVTDPNTNYTVTCVAGTLTISNRPSPSIPSVPSGGGSSSEPEPKKEVVKNSDGSTTTTVTDSKTGTVTETTVDKNGGTTVVETKKDGTITKTETKSDGAKSETVINPDGSSVSKATTAEGVQSESKKTAEGEITATVTLPDALNGPVVLPVEAAPVGKSVISIETETAAQVVIPAEKVSTGTVAVVVHADGTEEIVKRSVPSEDGIALTIDGSATIKLVDNAKKFDDVTGAAWYSDSVDFVSSREMLTGTAEDTFSPDKQMTRAMLTTVLARFDGQDTTGGEMWYSKGQKWAMENGISNGTNPNAAVTREQMVVMLYRYAKSQFAVETDGTGSISNFDDSAAISDWAQESMEWAIASGIINGKTANDLDPQGLATRAEVSTILMRFCKLLAE